MYKLGKNDDYKLQRDDADRINLFKPKLLQLFVNIKTITLITNKDIKVHRSLSKRVIKTSSRI